MPEIHDSIPISSMRQRSVSSLNRAWAWTRLAIAFALLEWALWTSGEAQRIASLAFILWVIVTTVGQRRKLQDLGLGLRGIRGAMIALPVAIVAAGLIFAAAWMFGTLRPLYGSKPLAHTLGYALWATIQEFLLNSYFFSTFEELLPRSRDAVLAAIALFTLAHIPNPVLMVGTLLASTFFVLVFRRFRNIYPLGIAHALLGLTLALTIPDAWIRHMRVGISYYHFVLK
jgi:Type II CAAX prenyl endopeptidase Rce1-like